MPFAVPQPLPASNTFNGAPDLSSVLPSAVPGNNIMDSIINILSMVMMLIQSLFSQLQGGGQNGLDMGQQSPFDTSGSNSDTQPGGSDSSGSCSGGQSAAPPESSDTASGTSGNDNAKSVNPPTGGVPAYGSPDWGAPAQDTTDPNGAYQVPGGFEPPK